MFSNPDFVYPTEQEILPYVSSAQLNFNVLDYKTDFNL